MIMDKSHWMFPWDPLFKCLTTSLVSVTSFSLNTAADNKIGAILFDISVSCDHTADHLEHKDISTKKKWNYEICKISGRL